MEHKHHKSIRLNASFNEALMKHLSGLFILVSLLSAYPLFSQSVGTTSFEFLKMQYSARGAAMGSNLIAVKGDVNSIFYNPASLASITERQYTINYVDHLLDFQGGQLAYTHPTQKFGKLSAGLIYFSYGDFDETNEFGERTGRSFSASEFALAVSIANMLGEGFDYGINVKFIYSSLESFNASAVAVDGGLIYTISQLENLQLALTVSNLGFTLDHYTSFEEKMPLLLRFGFAKRLAHLPLLFTGSLNDLSLDTGDFMDRLRRFSLGGEFDISEIIKLRLGYNNEVNQDIKPLGGRNFGGINAGLGILWKKFRFDYAYSAYGDLGSQNRLGVTGYF